MIEVVVIYPCSFNAHATSRSISVWTTAILSKKDGKKKGK